MRIKTNRIVNNKAINIQFKMKLLDCTLRDGGYYTNWDFSKDLVETYLTAINQLPIDIIEIGYRSNPQKEYLGEYFYCPQHVIDHVTSICEKGVAIMLNERDVAVDMLDELLRGCEKVQMVRLAIDPDNFERALVLARNIKARGFEVALNVMYMSDWSHKKHFMESLSTIDGAADYLNMVDSHGGIYPHEVREIYEALSEITGVTIGFHGHNNLELALINSLTALECGAGIIDATFTGMGRGAGNLKTELLLTVLDSKNELNVNYNQLGEIVHVFEELKKDYNWGSSLPYMIAGCNSYPQKEVMNWVSSPLCTYNSIVRTLQNKKDGIKDNFKLPILNTSKKYGKAIIVGGGQSAMDHCTGIGKFLAQHESAALIHAGFNNIKPYISACNDQYYCLVGDEGRLPEDEHPVLNELPGVCVLSPFPRKMGTNIPEKFEDCAFELKDMSFTDSSLDTHAAIALQTAMDLGVNEVYLVGFDGYSAGNTHIEKESAKENEYLFMMASKILKIKSLLPTEYNVKVESLYSMLHEK